MRDVTRQRTSHLIAFTLMLACSCVCRGQEVVALYTMNRDGSHAQLFAAIEEKEWNGSGCWSHDGTRIAFDTSTGKYGMGENHIMVRAVQGIRVVDLGLGAAPVWSPDDSEIAYMIERPQGEFDRRGIWISAADGKQKRYLCSGSRPSWSPDGKSIVYSDPDAGRNQLFVRDVATGAEKQLLRTSYRKIPGASYSPDGDYLTFIGYHRGEDQFDADLAVVDLRGPTPQLTVRMRGRIGWHPKWSPDGERLLFFVVDQERAFRIATIPPFGDDLPTILKDQADYFYNADASWSPDSSRIVFSSDRYADVDLMHVDDE